LISVSFCKKSIEEIAQIARQGGLDTIEWGGHKYVPPGDKEAIALANKACGDYGLTVSAYGSYYRCTDGEDFSAVLETAKALGTNMIRVWAGGGFSHSSE